MNEHDVPFVQPIKRLREGTQGELVAPSISVLNHRGRLGELVPVVP